MSAWKQKLVQSKMKESDFGVTFRKNAERIARYEESITAGKAQLVGADEKAAKKLNKKITILESDVAALDKKLCSNIDRAVKNPEAYKASKERVAAFSKSKKADGGTTAPIDNPPAQKQAAPPQVPTATPAQQQAAKPAAKPNTPASPIPPKPTKVVEEKKGISTTNIVVGCILGVLTLGVGAWWWLGRSSK